MSNVIIQSELYVPTVSNVLVNGKPVIVMGDMVIGHYPCPKPSSHCSATTIGTSTVLVNGKRLCKMGDMATCGHPLIPTQSTVLAN